MRLHRSPKRNSVEYLYNQGKTAGAGLCARFLRLSALPRPQRGVPRHLALHDIHDATVIDSDAYRRNGGGHFARWQSAITDWHRHLYVADSGVREVRSDEVLLLSDTPQTLPISPAIVLLPGGLATQQTRYAAIVPRDDLHHLATAAAVFIYQPITARLRNPAQRA